MMKIFCLILALAALSTAAPNKRGSSSSSSTSFDSLAQSILNDWPVDLETAEIVAQLIQDFAPTESSEVMPTATPMNLNCPSLPARTPATTIGLLHPQDVSVVGAIGDSVTCGSNALSTTWFNLKQYPGLSWSIGGDSGATTMTNLLGNYASVFGESTGTGDGVRNFNFAVGGAVVQDMPGQATNLVNAMKASTSIDYENDWKHVNIFIGGNNLCLVCDASKAADNNAAVYKAQLQQTLNILQALPKTLVSLNAHFDYTQLAKFKGPFCSIALGFVCDCLTSSSSSKQDAARAMMYQYNAVLQELEEEYNDPSRTDWAVVVQTGLVNATIPSDSYISTADCFHPSGSGQAFFGESLWNSLLSPMNAKPVALAPNMELICPTQDTLLFNPQSPASYSFEN